ncbi:MAG: hypothetical protein Q7T48_20425 [Cellvibrio sp.]|uniref:hypothetical protein n=1 Tax=Cellvibrio sp. TaxID=1965322 RepID=UPI002725848D|nr:hypothetical protein [Cellvibrio sp.]
MNKIIIFLLLSFFTQFCAAATQQTLPGNVVPLADEQIIAIPIQEPVKDLPIEVRLALNINKIYDIRPVDESFNVDAYLGANWLDPRAGKLVPENKTYITLEDSHVDEWHEHVWIPSLEIINILGPKDISNKRLIIYKDGRVFYNERFNATLQSSMNFRKFPFDTQKLQIMIEPFSYSASKMVFSPESRIYPTEHNAWPMLEWRALERACQIGEAEYEYLADSTAEKKFTQFAFSLTVERIPGYFLLQIFLPLAVIMLCAWSIFFVKDGATQLSLISTLMLTVYAFNFFITDSIPKLPYGTFLGKIIIISFISIFLQLIAHLVELRSEREFTAKQNFWIALFFVIGFGVANWVNWQHASMDRPTNTTGPTTLNVKACSLEPSKAEQGSVLDE